MDHTISLIRKSHHGDKEAREQLVKENVGLVWCVVKRFYGRGAEPEDLFQIGSIGLLKAIDKFDLSYDVQFSTYAVPMISGEIRRFLRDDGMIKVSRSLKKLSYKCEKKKEELTERMGREPTMEELATSLGTEKEELVQAMEAATEVESIYRPIHQEGDSQLSILDRLEEKSRPEEHLLNRMMLSQILDGGTSVDLSEVFSGKDTGSSGGDSGDFTGSGVENGKENTGADEKADVSRL